MKKLRKIILYLFLSLFLLSTIGVVLLFVTPYGHELRIMGAGTILSSQHRQYAKYLVSKKDLNEILNNIENPEYVNSGNEEDINQIAQAIKTKQQTKTMEILETLVKDDFELALNKKSSLIIEVSDIEKYYSPTSYYKGKIMTISNPFNLKLVSSQKKSAGEKITVLAERANAIAAINASGFNDPSGMGNGGSPIGIIFEDGQVTNTTSGMNTKDYIAGLTKEGVLITGYYSPNELLNYNVQYAAGFKPQLIVNGKKMITSGDGGWGIGPRTAIGQKSDGTIILIVIDGRQTHSIGATIKEVQDIMFENGAINATCMDGGSSSVMYFNNEVITKPSTSSPISRNLPNAWVITADEDTPVTLIYNQQKIEPK